MPIFPYFISDLLKSFIQYFSLLLSPLPANSSGQFVNPKSHSKRAFAVGIFFVLEHLSARLQDSSTLESFFSRSKIFPSTRYPSDPLGRIIKSPPKSSFKHLILETLLWKACMSGNLKNPPEGLNSITPKSILA